MSEFLKPLGKQCWDIYS